MVSDGRALAFSHTGMHALFGRMLAVIVILAMADCEHDPASLP
jgi:hypothetical protein